MLQMSDKLSVTFNEELRRLRIISKVTSKDIAEYIGLSTAWVSKMENGKLLIDQETYDKIKQFIGFKDDNLSKLMEEIRMKAYNEGFEKGKSCGFAKAQEIFVTIIQNYKM